MSIERVKEHLKKYGLEGRILEFAKSSATVEMAAEAAGCEPARIAKTLSFLAGEDTILLVAAGDAKVDNGAYKHHFGTKARMVPREEVRERIGHDVGGVCPFGVNPDVKVYLDQSLRRFTTVFPACGSSNSAIELTIAELERSSGFVQWVDVCKGWQDILKEKDKGGHDGAERETAGTDQKVQAVE